LRSGRSLFERRNPPLQIVVLPPEIVTFALCALASFTLGWPPFTPYVRSGLIFLVIGRPFFIGEPADGIFMPIGIAFPAFIFGRKVASPVFFFRTRISTQL